MAVATGIEINQYFFGGMSGKYKQKPIYTELHETPQNNIKSVPIIYNKVDN